MTSLTQARADLALTTSDALRCKTIHDNIVDFIRQNGGEDRSRFNTDRLQWQVLYEQATRLQGIIAETVKVLEYLEERK